MSGYRQEVFNVVLAQLLQERGLVTAPESVVRVGDARERRMPDVIVSFDGLRTAIEGEVDDQPDCEQRAVTSAMKRVEEGIAHIGVAVVYPADLRRLDFQPLKEALATRVLRINVLAESAEPVGRFVEGTVDYLGSALRQTFNLLVQENIVSKAAELLERGIEGFAAAMVSREAEVGRVARALDIREITIEAREAAGHPKQEKLQYAMRTAVGRITGLVLANAFIFQEILSNHNTEVHPLGRVLAGRNPKGDFVEHWQFIKDEINYYPILHIAQEALLSLSSSPDISLGIERLVEIAQEIVRMRAALRHDLMGRIYHRLLEKAQKYLGTCYTSIPAAIILLKTALRPTAWTLDWSDVSVLSSLRVADLASGTGTLLMAVADAVTDNYIGTVAARPGATLDVAELQKVLVESVIYGYDVLLSAVHLTASTLAMRAPRIAFDHFHLYCLPLGGRDLRLGSIEYIIGSPRPVNTDLFSAPSHSMVTTGKGMKEEGAPPYALT